MIALKVAVLWPLARGTNLMSEPLYQQGLLVVLLSMLVTPALAWAAVRLNRRQDDAPAAANR